MVIYGGICMRSRFALLLVLMAIIMQVGLVAQSLSPEQEKRIQRLEKIFAEQEQLIKQQTERLKQQEQRILHLQGRLKEKTKVVKEVDKGYIEKVVSDYMKRPEAQEEGLTAGWEDQGREKHGFFIKTADSKYELYLSGWMQAGVGFFENDTFDNNSIFANGIVLATDVYIYSKWHARVEVNFTTYTGQRFRDGSAFALTQVMDAYLEYMPMAEANIRAGHFGLPVGLESQYNANEGLTIWTSPFTAWNLSREAAMMLYGTVNNMVEYSIALSNGDGAGTFSMDDDWLLSGKLRFYFFGKKENGKSFFEISGFRGRNEDAAVRAGMTTPWGRPVYGNVGLEGTTEGWRTGASAAVRFDQAVGGLNNIRMESEFLFQRWERHTTGLRGHYLQGWGFSWGVQYRHNLNPEVKESGLLATFKFSYTDIDDIGDNTPNNGVEGQRQFVYTAGLGYVFNKHITAQVNWVVVNLAEKDLYNSATEGAKDDRADGSDDIEHGWFFQVTMQW